MGRADGLDGFTLLALATGTARRLPCGASLPSRPYGRSGVQNFLVEHGPEGPRVGWRANDQAPAVGPLHRLAVRHAGALCDQGRDGVERPQGAPDRNVRR